MTRREFRSALLSLAVLVASCSEGTVGTMTPPPPPTVPNGLALTGPGPFLVSDAPARAGTAAGGVAGISEPGLAWVALRPGTLSGFTSVTLKVQRTGVESVNALTNGGLDPVAIGAVRGDTVVLRVSGGSGPFPAALVFTVPERAPPVIVRTVPPRGTRDVALNSRMHVVFSEPVGLSALQPGAIVLQADGTPVAGEVRFVNPQHTVVEFEPIGLLNPRTAYQLVIGQQVGDLDGMALADVGTVEFVTVGTLPAPVEGGTTVGEFAFVRDKQIFRSTAQGVFQLTNTPVGYSNRSPAWSPDGSRIAFVSDRAESPCPVGLVCLTYQSIYVMNADGSNVVRLTSGNADYEPAWTPDGLSLVYAGDFTRIFRISATGGVPTLLLESSAGVSSPSISPDGSSLLVSISRNPAPAGSWWGWAFDMYRMSLAPGASPALVHAGPSGPRIRHFVDGAWSPDGQWIAMTQCVDELVICGGDATLDVVRADGTGYAILARPNDFSYPSWSPDGTRIAYSTVGGCTGFTSCIAVIAATGGTPEVILQNASDPSWRP